MTRENPPFTSRLTAITPGQGSRSPIFDFSPNVVEDENAVRRAQRRSRRPGREATIPPSPLIVHCCHCSWCQRQNGSAFAVNALVEADRVHLLQGDVVDVEVPSPSGANQRISRCPKCQVAVWSYYLVFYGGIGERVRFIRVGTLDDPGRLPPDVHIYTSSKQPWLVLPEDALAVEEYYVSKEVWPKESLERLAALLNSVQG